MLGGEAIKACGVIMVPVAEDDGLNVPGEISRQRMFSASPSGGQAGVVRAPAGDGRLC